MAGKHGSKVNLGNATHGDNKSSQDKSNKDRAGRATMAVGGKESGGAKCAPCYEGADELAKSYEKVFIKDMPSIEANS